jgi:hypothetical protein
MALGRPLSPLTLVAAERQRLLEWTRRPKTAGKPRTDVKCLAHLLPGCQLRSATQRANATRQSLSARSLVDHWHPEICGSASVVCRRQAYKMLSVRHQVESQDLS